MQAAQLAAWQRCQHGALLEAQFWPEARCEYGVFSGRPADFAAFCMTMLSDGVKNKELEESVKNRDVLELAADSLVG